MNTLNRYSKLPELTILIGSLPAVNITWQN